MKTINVVAACASLLFAQPAVAQVFEENRTQVGTDNHLVLERCNVAIPDTDFVRRRIFSGKAGQILSVGN